MRIKEKLHLDMEGLLEHGPITIVAFGDSVTHGLLACDEFNYETVYWNRLRKKLLAIRDYVPVNVIDAGISGTTATQGVVRLEKQVLVHQPDLVIVCFGLNDVNGSLEDYLTSLESIFLKIRQTGAEIIFMTPNMLNTSVAEDTPKEFYEYAIKTAKMQNEGKMDLYMDSAVQLAKKMGIQVCDCYKKWKELSKTQDTTYLLANRINHPTAQMHELFAESLLKIIMEDDPA